MAEWGVGGSSLVGRTDEKGIEHDSSTPRVRAKFITMRYSQVFNDNRCSKPSMPHNTATQVSCTTSSACASVATYIRAVRCRGAVPIEQPREGSLVAVAKRVDQLRVVGVVAGRRRTP